MGEVYASSTVYLSLTTFPSLLGSPELEESRNSGHQASLLHCGCACGPFRFLTAFAGCSDHGSLDQVCTASSIVRNASSQHEAASQIGTLASAATQAGVLQVMSQGSRCLQAAVLNAGCPFEEAVLREIVLC